MRLSLRVIDLYEETAVTGNGHRRSAHKKNHKLCLWENRAVALKRAEKEPPFAIIRSG